MKYEVFFSPHQLGNDPDLPLKGNRIATILIYVRSFDVIFHVSFSLYFTDKFWL